MSPHLHKIGQTWYYRQVVPRDLKPYFKVSEIKHSLRSKSKTTAKLLLSAYDLHYQQLFSSLRINMPPKISRQAVILWQQQNPGKPFIPPELGYGVAGKSLLNTPEALSLLLEYGFVPNVEGKFDTTLPPAMPTPAATQQPVVPAPVVPAPVAPVPHKLLSEAWNEYVTFKTTDSKTNKAWKDSTAKEYGIQFGKFCRFTGNCSVTEAVDKIDAYTTVDYDAGLRAKSINNFVKMIKPFVQWCHNNKYLTSTPIIERVAISDAEALDHGNKGYTLEMLQSMINYLATDQVTQIECRQRRLEFCYFLLICLLTGNRKEEAIRLQSSDILLENGYICINYRETGTKSTAASRIVPIPDKLKALHIEAYFKKHNGRLFSLGYHSYRDELLAVKQAAGVPMVRNKYTFHSMRHNAYTTLNTLKCPEPIRCSLIGHAQKGMNRIYDEPDPERLEKMYYYVNLMHRKLDFSALQSKLKSELEYFYS